MAKEIHQFFISPDKRATVMGTPNSTSQVGSKQNRPMSIEAKSDNHSRNGGGPPSNTNTSVTQTNQNTTRMMGGGLSMFGKD